MADEGGASVQSDRMEAGRSIADGVTILRLEEASCLSLDELAALLKKKISITGDGNVVGNDNTVTVVKHENGNYVFNSPQVTVDLSPEALRNLLAPPAYAPPDPPDPDTIPKPDCLPPGSRMLYPRNASFTGRTGHLRRLARTLLHRDGSSLVAQAIQGMGGVGKTQLAVEFVHRYGRFLHGVHWIDAAQPDAIPAEVAACGAVMAAAHRGPFPEKQSAQVAWTLAAWQRGGPRLIVLDNMEDMKAYREWLGKMSGGPLRLLLTTRQQDWPRDLGLKRLGLDVFTPEESRSFLGRYVADVPASTLARLARRLGHLPLALELAARYLDSFQMAGVTGLSVDDYLAEFDKCRGALTHASMQDWPEAEGSSTNHDLNLVATFDLSYEALNLPEKELFKALGVFAPVVLSVEHILAVCGRSRKEALLRLRSLKKLSLIQGREVAGEIRYAVHPLLRDYVVFLTSEAEREHIRIDMGRNLVSSLASSQEPRVQPIVAAEALLALGWGDRPPDTVRLPVMTSLRETMRQSPDDVERREAASLLTRLGWLQDLQTPPVSAPVDASLAEFLTYLELFNRYLSILQLDDVEEIINRLALACPPDGAVEQSRVLLRLAMLKGREGEHFGDVDLLEASAGDYRQAQKLLEPLPTSSAKQKMLGQAALGSANIFSVWADLMERKEPRDGKTAHGLRNRAITFYERALASALDSGDQLMAITIWGELCHTWALLHEWEKASGARTDALDALDALEAGDSGAYAWDRAWILNVGADMYLRKGLALESAEDCRIGYRDAVEAVGSLMGVSDGLQDMGYAEITAGDCAWATAMLDPAAESRREVAREHWRRAAKAAEQLGGEQLVIEESLFYARLKGDEADETSDR